MSKHQAPRIVKYTDLSATDGYAFIYYENGEDGYNYTENLTFTKFEGSKLLAPYRGTSAQVEVPANSDNIVIVKLGAAWGLSYKMSMSI